MEKIKIEVQTEKRLKAINNLSEAVLNIARALQIGTHVSISDCYFKPSEDGKPLIEINTKEKVKETKIINPKKE